MAIMKLRELDSTIYEKYNVEYQKLVGDESDHLSSFDVQLFSYLTRLALNHAELDKSKISNYDFVVIAKLLVNGHVSMVPELVISRELWNLMTGILFEVDIKEI